MNPKDVAQNGFGDAYSDKQALARNHDPCAIVFTELQLDLELLVRTRADTGGSIPENGGFAHRHRGKVFIGM